MVRCAEHVGKGNIETSKVEEIHSERVRQEGGACPSSGYSESTWRDLPAQLDAHYNLVEARDLLSSDLKLECSL